MNGCTSSLVKVLVNELPIKQPMGILSFLVPLHEGPSHLGKTPDLCLFESGTSFLLCFVKHAQRSNFINHTAFLNHKQPAVSKP
jgi:hypothetical protein